MIPMYQGTLSKYPNRIETYDERRQQNNLVAWKPFDSAASARLAFDDLCERYERQHLVGIYRLVQDNEGIQELNATSRTLTAIS